VGNKYEVSKGHIETKMLLIGYNKYDTPQDEEKGIFRCTDCEPGSERWLKYCRKFGYKISNVWKKKSPTANQKSDVLQDKAKEIVRCVCKINKKGEAIFTSRIVEKEIKRKFQSQGMKATVTVVSKSTAGTSGSTATTPERKSSASPVVKTAHVTTNRSASPATSRAGKSCKDTVSTPSQEDSTKTKRRVLTFASRRSSTFSKK